MNLDQKVTFAETVFAQEVDGEMVLLDMLENDLSEFVSKLVESGLVKVEES